MLLAVVLIGLFAMHGLGTGHQMPAATATDMHVMSAGHAPAMAPLSSAPRGTAVLSAVPRSYTDAGGRTRRGGMGMDSCVAILTAAALLVALVMAACRRHDLHTVPALRNRQEIHPQRAPPKPGALTLAQLCVLRT